MQDVKFVKIDTLPICDLPRYLWRGRSQDTLGGRQEMAFNRNVGKYVSTDRLVIITDNGIQDTGDI